MNDNVREDQFEDVALYALGVLPDADAARMRALIEGDAELRREYEELRAAADSVAFAAEGPVDSARSARMRERLLATVRADASAAVPGVARRRIGPASTAWFWGTGLAAAAAIVIALTTGLQEIGLRSDLTTAQRNATGLQSQLSVSERLAAADRRTLTDILSPDSRRLDVAHGTVIVRGRHVYFALSTLAPLQRGKTYQAWYLPKGAKAVVPSVTFPPNAQGVAIVELPIDARTVGAVALSVEPEGGSKAPTTTPIFVRPLS
jgi:anti-sigma-K factor RskA